MNPSDTSKELKWSSHPGSLITSILTILSAIDDNKTPVALKLSPLSDNPYISPMILPLSESQEKSNINVAFAAPIHPVNAITPKILVTVLNIPISFYKLNRASRAQK